MKGILKRFVAWHTGYVVASEIHLINTRLMGGEEIVLPVLLAGDERAALPPLVRGRVFADFRDDAAYFANAFDLILSLYRLSRRLAAVADLRESLRPSKLR